MTYMINQEQLDNYRQRLNQLKIKVSPLEYISNVSNLAENEYPELVEELLAELQKTVSKGSYAADVMTWLESLGN